MWALLDQLESDEATSRFLWTAVVRAFCFFIAGNFVDFSRQIVPLAGSHGLYPLRERLAMWKKTFPAHVCASCTVRG